MVSFTVFSTERKTLTSRSNIVRRSRPLAISGSADTVASPMFSLNFQTLSLRAVLDVMIALFGANASSRILFHYFIVE